MDNPKATDIKGILILDRTLKWPDKCRAITSKGHSQCSHPPYTAESEANPHPCFCYQHRKPRARKYGEVDGFQPTDRDSQADQAPGAENVEAARAKSFSIASDGHVPYTVDSNGGPRATAFRFLDLPVELRDMVYKGLLCPHIDGSQYRRYESIQDYGLEPAILRTCKQICVEGSQVLYEKNSTVLIRLDAQAWRAFEKRSWDPTFQEIFPSARVEGGKVGGTPVLAIDMSVLPQYHIKGKREPKEQAVFIGFLPGLPKFCRFLTASCWCNMTLQLVINMEGLGARGPKVRQQMLSDCLDYFCEVRGLGGAVILTEPQHRATAAKVAHVMKKDEESINKAFGPIRAYEARVLRQLQEKRWNDARDTLQNALEFMGLLRRRLCIERYWNGTDKKLTHKLVVKMMETQWKYISICLKVGRTGDVHHQIRQMFRYSYDADKLTPAEQKAYSDRLADAHHAIGQAYLIDGFLNSAVYSFLQVLFTALGHREADEAIDLLEKRLKSSSKPEDVMVKLNIETVLEEVRHQGPNQHRLSKGQRKDTVEGFRATYQETEGLRRSRKLHTGIEIMEPSNAPPSQEYDL